MIPSKKQTARYFRAVCHWIKERYEAGNTVIFCSISFFVSFCLYFKESCSCTGVHQLIILIKSGCDSLCRRKSGRIPEFSSGISGKLYNSLRRNSSHMVKIGRRTLIHKKAFEKWLTAQTGRI